MLTLFLPDHRSLLQGLALALSLKQHNISATILELRSRNTTSGGFLALAPNACRTLQRIGAYDRISAQGYNYDELQFFSARNMSHIGTIWNGHHERYGFKACRVARGIVRETLLDMVHEQNIEIRYGVKVTDVREDQSRKKVLLTISDGTTEEADLLIGADGIHSRLRSHINSDATPRFSGQMGLGGVVDASKLGTHGTKMPCMIMGKDHTFAFMPCTPNADNIGVFATVEAQDRPREKWDALMGDKEQLAKIFCEQHGEGTEWPELVKTAAREIDGARLWLWPFYKVPILEQWRSRSSNIILIGDAAHGIPPTGGQGAAMAFEDAVTLADVIAANKVGDGDLAEKLDGWQTRRKARIQKVVAFTGQSGDARKASKSWVQQVVKEWAMWAYFWVKGPEMGLGWMYDYDTEKIDA